MNLKIEIPFDEKTYIRQCMLRWTLVNQKTTKSVKSTLIVWSIVFTIGILAGIEDGQYVNGGTIAGGLFLAYAVWMLILFITGKRKYKRQLIEMAREFKNKNYIGAYEFTDSFIRYVDKQRDVKLDWETFDSYTVLDKDILLNQSGSFESSYVLGEDELTTNKYMELKAFLSTKLKLKEV